ncbi:MAG: ABC transporter ATP-binding protein [Parvularculaceae bacterium]|nr:ABC transporter ATP-binding protein [Parvularculaceae bacterium]
MTSPSSFSLARRLWREFLGRQAPRLVLALGAMGVYALSAAAIPAGVEWINARLSGEEPSLGAVGGNVAIVGPAIVLLLGIVNAGAQYVQARLSASAALHALKDMQRAIFDRLLALDDAQLRALGPGQSISMLTNDVGVLRETLQRALTAVRDLLTLLALVAVMIWYDAVLFLVVAGIYAIIGWPVARIGAGLRKGSRAAQAQSGEIASLANEAVAGARTIRAYNLEGARAAHAEGAFTRRLSTLLKMATLRALNEPFIFLVGALAMAIVIAVVAFRISAGALNVPQFVSFIIALLMLSQPARGLSTLNAVAQEGFGAFERIAGLLDTAPRIAGGGETLRTGAGAVSFRDVIFSYDGAGRALDRLTLDVPGGKTVALVGESGAGKSTVFNLLLRLYDPEAGAILIDGQRIDAVSLASLRQSIALVSQDAFLFNDTIAANIAMGRPGASREEIEAAARAASADAFIRRLPNGYEALAGEGGGALSGGERQRIAIARAFLKDAPILLLDEATAALDAESEAAIQAALATLMKGRTTIVIAHRLSTIRAADLIVAIDRGRVAEAGTHEALTAKGGYYARVAGLQRA